MAGKPTPSSLGDSYKTFDTASAAAIEALRGITDRKLETGGGILYNADQKKYAYTQPVGQADNAHFTAAVRVPQGWSLASTYHTHPFAPQSTRFSDDDIDMATKLKAPSYVLARQDNKIRMFDPASSKVSKDVVGKFAPGDLVDETPPNPQQQKPSLPAGQAPGATAPAAAETAVPGAAAAAATIPVAGSRITMTDFAVRHRATRVPARSKTVLVKK